MMANMPIKSEQFFNENERLTRSYQHIPSVVEKLIAASWNSTVSGDHEASRSIPSQDSIVRIIHQARWILFPGYFTQTRLDPVNLEYSRHCPERLPDVFKGNGLLNPEGSGHQHGSSRKKRKYH